MISINTIQSKISIISSKVNVKESLKAESEEQVRWYPIICWDSSDLLLGVNDEGMWVVEAKSGLHILCESNSFWRLVSLLEQPFSKIRITLDEFFNKLEIPLDIDNVFPFVEIVRAGFEFGTKHWAEKAFEWYDELLPEKKAYLTESLVKLKTAQWASQKLRHKAMKELKKMGVLNG